MHPFRLFAAFPLALLTVFAHWPWMEPARSDSPMKVYFGVFPSEKMSGDRVQAMTAAKVWTYRQGAGFQAAQAVVESGALNLGAADGGIMDYPFGVYAGHGPATLVLYSAKAFRGRIPAGTAAALPLEIVAVREVDLKAGTPARFQLRRNGRPLAAAVVHAYTDAQGERHLAAVKAKKIKANERHAEDHDHDHKPEPGSSTGREESGEIPGDALQFTTDASGEFSLVLPAAGRYQFHASVREETPGAHHGTPYQSVTLMTTVCVDIR